jgi:hypothetical protein
LPVHAPIRQVWFTQAVAPPKVPSAWQVSRLLPEHVVCPGAQTPWHAAAPPVTTHVLLLQVAAALQFPAPSHDSTPLPAQRVCPGAHTPVQALPTHVWFTHAVAVFQVPDVLHVCSADALAHCVWPWAHTPEHAVPMHVWFTQFAGAFHAPEVLHVCCCVSPLHCV